MIDIIKLRITYSDVKEKEVAIDKLKESFIILNISKEYKGRGESKYSNVYLDVENKS